MEKWKLAAFAAMLLLLLVIVVDVVVIARYAMLPRPSAAVNASSSSRETALDTARKPAPFPVAETTKPSVDTSKFPAPPSANGVEKEYWEGYYYSSLDPFEQAVAAGVQRWRFWFEVRRTADGTFQAACNENSGLGDARIEGQLDRAAGQMRFVKTYTNGGRHWQYEGEWSAAQQRIVGTYGGANGGFVLYPRRLRQEEIARFEMPNAGDVPFDVLTTPRVPAPRVAPRDQVF